MAKIVYTQIPAPSGATPTNLTSQAKAWMQKPQGGGKILVQIPRVCTQGGMVIAKIDTFISFVFLYLKRKSGQNTT